MAKKIPLQYAAQTCAAEPESYAQQQERVAMRKAKRTALDQEYWNAVASIDKRRRKTNKLARAQARGRLTRQT